MAEGALEQPDRLPTIPIAPMANMHVAMRAKRFFKEVFGERDGMTLLLLEALLALVILIAIVWWTMFSGRHKGELQAPEASDKRDPQDTEKP